MLLELKDVSKEYEIGVKVLENVSFSVEKGEFVSIIGSSGSGKSTLLRSINRMIDITSGEILFEGTHIEKLKRKEINKFRRKIGMIFQSYNLIPVLTVYENVEFILDLTGKLGKAEKEKKNTHTH